MSSDDHQTWNMREDRRPARTVARLLRAASPMLLDHKYDVFRFSEEGAPTFMGALHVRVYSGPLGMVWTLSLIEGVNGTVVDT